MGNTTSSDARGSRMPPRRMSLSVQLDRSMSHDSHKRIGFGTGRHNSQLHMFGRASIDAAPMTRELSDSALQRASSGSHRLPPPPPSRRPSSQHSASKFGHVSSFSSVPVPRDTLGRVAEAVDEEPNNEDGLPMEEPVPEEVIGGIRPERSHSEGTGIVSVSTARTTREPEPELVRLEKIPKFGPLIPYASASYFKFGSWLPSAQQSNRYVEMDVAIDHVAMAGIFLAYQLQQKSLADKICTEQRNIMNTVRLLDELVSSTHQAVSNQVKAMEELHTRVVSQIDQLQDRVLHTQDHLRNIVETLGKLDRMLPKDELSLDNEALGRRFPTLGRIYGRKASKYSSGVSVFNKRLSITKHNWDRNSATVVTNQVVFNVQRTGTGSFSHTTFSNGSTSSAAATQLQLLRQRDLGNASTPSLASSLRSSTLRLAGLRGQASRPFDVSVTQLNEKSPATSEGDDDMEAEQHYSVDIDGVLAMAARAELPDQASTPKQSSLLLSGALREQMQTYPQARPHSRAAQENQSRSMRHARSSRGESMHRQRERSGPYDVQSGRNSIKRQKARTSSQEVDRIFGSPTRVIGSLMKRIHLSISSSNTHATNSNSGDTHAGDSIVNGVGNTLQQHSQGGTSKNTETTFFGIRGLPGRRRSGQHKSRPRTTSMESSSTEPGSGVYSFANATTSVINCAKPDTRQDDTRLSSSVGRHDTLSEETSLEANNVSQSMDKVAVRRFRARQAPSALSKSLSESRRGKALETPKN